MDGAMMGAAKRDGEFITGFTTQSARLREAQMMCVGRLAAAEQAGLLRDKTQVLAVAISAWSAEGENALVDARCQVGIVHRWRGFLLRRSRNCELARRCCERLNN